MRFHIWTVGCQMNVADSERMATALTAMGGMPATKVQDADVIVLNTCSVRQAAEDRALGKLAALKSLKRRHPDLIIALAGCMVGEDSLPVLHERLPFVDAFIRPADVEALRETVRALAPAGSLLADIDAAPKMEAAAPTIEAAVPLADVRLHPSPHLAPVRDGLLPIATLGRPPLAERERDTTPVRWVPVIYGCNRSCSYCIVPTRRGRERSRPLDEIEAEVRTLVTEGAREVRLLGQIVDRYGWDMPDKPDLSVLFARLAAIEGLHRIRFLTSHPRDLRERVIGAIAEQPKVCPDINIPFQAGDDAILRSMRRGYTIGFYRKLIAHLRQRIPGVALSTDVIVGYPGESDEQFEHTIDVLTDLRFEVVHVAMYSPRPGTIATALPDDVPQEVKKDRLRRVEELQAKISSEQNASLVGEIVEILVEDRRKGQWEGRTPTNKLVFFADERDWLGQLALVRIDYAGPWSLRGTVIDDRVGR